jgi:hypothetical protein
MRLQKKSISKVSLTDLLRRRKTTLSNFLEETGIVTYELLVERCSSSGVLAPSLADFLSARGSSNLHTTSSPTEGVVVLNPPDEVKMTSETGSANVIPFVDDSEDVVNTESTEKSTKRKRKTIE